MFLMLYSEIFWIIMTIFVPISAFVLGVSRHQRSWCYVIEEKSHALAKIIGSLIAITYTILLIWTVTNSFPQIFSDTIVGILATLVFIVAVSGAVAICYPAIYRFAYERGKITCREAAKHQRKCCHQVQVQNEDGVDVEYTSPNAECPFLQQGACRDFCHNGKHRP